MGKTLYLECYSGISGDMTVAALLDLGADQKHLEEALSSLLVQGFRIEISRVIKSGLNACDFSVILDQDNHDHDMEYLHGQKNMEESHEHQGHGHMHKHDHEHRGMKEIQEIIQRSSITERAKQTALRIFEILVEAEAKAHGVSVEKVHFHEVGAIDSIVDIVSIAVCLDDLDITNTEEVLNFGIVNRPDVIINCCGVTDTDLCEKEPEHAYRVNALGARNLSIVARKNGAKIVQLSTDDVFDGKSKKPYTEFDDTNPLTVYGSSKRAGENYVKEFTHKHFILRSNWVYGNGNNFVNRVLHAADTKDELLIASDQFGSPTSAKDLARIILYLIKTNEYGTYHATCQGVCNRYEFAQEVLKLAGKRITLRPVVTSESDLSSARPAYAVLDNFILRIINVYEMPDWRASLKEYMDERMED